MRLSGFIFLFGTVLNADAWAISVPNAPCVKDMVQQISESAHQIQKASIAQNDTRALITDNWKALGLLESDVTQIRENFGFLHCPGTKYKNVASASSFIVESSKAIMSNSHVLIDDYGRPRDPLSKCYFQTQGKSSIRISLNLKDGIEGLRQAEARGLLRFGSKDFSDQARDRVVVALKEPVPNAKPFRTARVPINLHGCDGKTGCQSIVAVSAYQERMPFPVDGRIPIAQECNIVDTFPGPGGRGGTFRSNCSSTEGSSGSINFLKDEKGNFLRNEFGELVPIGLFTGGGFGEFDGQPYSLAAGNTTRSLVLEGPAVDDIRAVAKLNDRTVQLNSRITPAAQSGL